MQINKDTMMSCLQSPPNNGNTNVSGSDFVVKVSDGFCEFEYGFTCGHLSISDLVKSIETMNGITMDYCKKL